MDPELKKLLDEQMKVFDAFKAANDTMQKQIEKLGSADAVTADEVKKLNARLDDIGAELKKANDLATEAAKIANRPGGKAADDVEVKHLAAFNQQIRLAHQLKGNAAPPALDIEQYREYKRVLNIYLRKGDAGIIGDAERKTMSVGSDPDGGFWVTPDMGGRIIQKVFETSPMRSVASIQTIGTDALEGANDLEEGSAGWVAEQGARPATATPQIGKWRIPVEEMYAMPEATQKLLDDAMVDVEAWLSGKVADKFTRLENTAFVTGDGVGKPRGFTTYPTAATADASRAWGTFEHVATGTSASFGTSPNGSDKLVDLVHKPKVAYRNGAVFAMNRATVGEVRKLKDGNNQYIWLPSMLSTQPASLLGYGVIEFEDMAAIAANSLSIAFGNFALGYQIVDRQGIRVLRDPYTNKPYVRFYTTRRVGGDALHFEALKFLKFSTS